MSQPEIIVADHAGFCFGVTSAVNSIQKEIGKNPRVYAMSEIVHNPRVNSDLEKEGLHFVPNKEEIPDDAGYFTLIVSKEGRDFPASIPPIFPFEQLLTAASVD